MEYILLLHWAERFHRHPHQTHAEDEDECEHAKRRGLEEEACGDGQDRWGEACPIGHSLGLPEGIDSERVVLASRHDPDETAEEDDETGIDGVEDADILPGADDLLRFIGSGDDGFPFIGQRGVEFNSGFVDWIILVDELIAFQGIVLAIDKGVDDAGGWIISSEDHGFLADGEVAPIKRGDAVFAIWGFGDIVGGVGGDVGEEGDVV